MPPSFTSRRVFALLAATTIVTAGTQAAIQLPQDADQRRLGANFDVRLLGAAELAAILEGAPGGAASLLAAGRQRTTSVTQALTALQAEQPMLDWELSPFVGGPELLRSRRGALTAPAPGRSGEEIVRDFFLQHAALFGLTAGQVDALRFHGESKSASGLRMVRVEQIVDGLAVFQSDTRVTLDREGRIVRTVGRLVPGLSAGFDLENRISAREALVAALEATGMDVALGSLTDASPGALDTELASSDPFVTDVVPSQLVLFPLGPGIAIPAWSQVIFTRGDGDFYTVVSARDGRLLYRKNIRAHAGPVASDRVEITGKGAAVPVTEDARFSVYVQGDGVTPAESPAPQSPTNLMPADGTQFPEITRTTVNMLTAYDSTASPEGWIPDGGNTTTGNNVDAYLDTNGDNTPDAAVLDLSGRPQGNTDASTNDRDFLGDTPRDYDYTPPPTVSDPDVGDIPSGSPFRRGLVTQLFYVTNWYHDRLYDLGFDEAAGNFQQDNFGNGGSGTDRVLAEAQDNSTPTAGMPSANNANFATPPDGTSGRMQMFLFNFPDPDRDGSLDTFIVIHELTHGLSNRLVGNAAGLNWSQGPGMGEGWSDFYALALLNPTNASDPDGQYHSGAYATYQLGGLTDNYLYGIRRFPYTTDNAINPLTFADTDDVTDDMSGGIAPSPLGFQFSGASEVHNSGELWALALWEMRSRIIAANAGDVPTGGAIALQLVTDGLKMTLVDPTFGDARDAILDADCAANACANEESIWGGFADRGLGYGATTSSGVSVHYGVKESFAPPFLDGVGLTLDDSAANASGFADPGEVVDVTVELFNPWQGASKDVASATATIVGTSPGVGVVDAMSSYGAIPAQGSASGSDPFTVALPANAPCGSTIELTLEVTSSLGTTQTTLAFRLGDPTGAGTPVTYTRTIPGGLDLPTDGSPLAERAGVADTMTIADDFEILDVDVRIDDLTHPWIGDVTLEIRGPNGYGTDIVFAMAGGCDVPPLGLGLFNNCGDDFVDTVIDDEAMGDLLIALFSVAPFTGSWFPVFNSPAWTFPDTNAQLANFDGASTGGDWTVFTSDTFLLFDHGTLNEWSLIVTPQTHACSSVADVLFADGFESGDTSAWSLAVP